MSNQDQATYKHFLKEKGKRTAPDLYAAFQPFNESSRAFEPFVPFLKKNLKPGDVILDTWCRTGWSSLYLSGLFPEQKILSVWEGNKGVLGYQGFLFWFEKSKRPDNLEIIFTDNNQTLPLPDHSIRLVYGLDTLHRYKKPTLINELIRVSAEDGFIIFPHVHLDNSRPDPFFERGGDIKLGSEWDFYLTNKLTGTNRKHFIFSEPALFEFPEKTPFISTPEMEDYNGLIGIFPDTNIPTDFEKWEAELSDPDNQFIGSL
ncbi:MAG: hypothetical protein J0L62_07105 [Bacteroidetes bacterium]|nr:hypothetical protein [Bacteroidota bacterium]